VSPRVSGAHITDTTALIPAIKTALNALGFPAGTPRKPLAELDTATAATISKLATELPQFSASA
jgi:hypothetical protein